jgi:hypothetical protein
MVLKAVVIFNEIKYTFLKLCVLSSLWHTSSFLRVFSSFFFISLTNAMHRVDDIIKYSTGYKSSTGSSTRSGNTRSVTISSSLFPYTRSVPTSATSSTLRAISSTPTTVSVTSSTGKSCPRQTTFSMPVFKLPRRAASRPNTSNAAPCRSGNIMGGSRGRGGIELAFLIGLDS